MKKLLLTTLPLPQPQWPQRADTPPFLVVYFLLPVSCLVRRPSLSCPELFTPKFSMRPVFEGGLRRAAHRWAALLSDHLPADLPYVVVQPLPVPGLSVGVGSAAALGASTKSPTFAYGYWPPRCKPKASLADVSICPGVVSRCPRSRGR